MPIATLNDNQQIEYDEQTIGEGAEKIVHFSKDRKYAVCFYRDQNDISSPTQRQRLQVLLTGHNVTQSHPHFAELFCWPVGIVAQPKIGVITPIYPDCFHFTSGGLNGRNKTHEWFVSEVNRERLREEYPKEVGDFSSRVAVCAKLARAVRKLHSTGLAHSDLSMNNILVDFASCRCLVTDCDMLVVPDSNLNLSKVAGTRGYMAPELAWALRWGLDNKLPEGAKPSVYTDRHSLAVLIYELLLGRHPLNGNKVWSVNDDEDDFHRLGDKAIFFEDPKNLSIISNKVKKNTHSNAMYLMDGLHRDFKYKVSYTQLGTDLQEVMHKTFIDGLHQPGLRPTANSWECALYRTYDRLLPCGNPQCEGRFFVYTGEQQPQCQWCGWKLYCPTPVLKFYRKDGGQFFPDGWCLTARPGRMLFEWHTCRGKLPDENANRKEVKAEIVYDAQHQPYWFLKNRAIPNMREKNGNLIPIGNQVPLQEGSRIFLGPETVGKMAEIKMIGIGNI